MEKNDVSEMIRSGRTALGIELGSTRIKAVLTGEDHVPIAVGSYDWENRLEQNIWTYDLKEVWTGVQESYRKLAEDAEQQYGQPLYTVGAIGISAMMHGYLVFDQKDTLLVPFRTWRNTITQEASQKLTEVFQYNIPQRWSIAHLYQAILNKEPHRKEIAFLTTLSGYVHWKLTGRKVLGIGDASGMFPVNTKEKGFNQSMIAQFCSLVAPEQLSWKLLDILPQVLTAGEDAGTLTETGAKLLDVTGRLRPGIPLCPPEGDAGTGMTATNSVAKRTGNVSAGTSVFAMAVLEKELSKVYPQLDMVTTPSGNLVAMAHCNNCTSDLNAWVGLFREFAESLGIRADSAELFSLLYQKALEGDADCGGLLAYNYFSGEPVTEFEAGRPLFVRTPECRFNLANFMRVHLFTALGALKLGLDLLVKQEHVRIDRMTGHGGLFKTKEAGQKIMAAAVNVPVTILETAGEGGAWGIALLAAYRKNKKPQETLEDYLNDQVFRGQKGSTLEPDPKDVEGFETFMKRYEGGLPIERAAVDYLK